MEGNIATLSDRYSLGAPDNVNCLLFLLVKVVFGTKYTSLSMIISQSPMLVKKLLAMRLRIYSLISPISMNWYPLFSEVCFLFQVC